MNCPNCATVADTAFCPSCGYQLAAPLETKTVASVPAPSPRQRSWRWPLALVAILVILGAAGFVRLASPRASSTQTIQGTVAVDGSPDEYLDLVRTARLSGDDGSLTEVTRESNQGRYTQPCPKNSSAFRDLRNGTAVEIRDAVGKIIATAALTDGRLVLATQPAHEGAPDIRGCIFSFEVQVPTNTDFYRVQVGHRGEVTFDRQGLELNDWRMELSIAK